MPTTPASQPTYEQLRDDNAELLAENAELHRHASHLRSFAMFARTPSSARDDQEALEVMARDALDSAGHPAKPSREVLDLQEQLQQAQAERDAAKLTVQHLRGESASSPRQDAVEDQLKTVQAMAVSAGCYDAADWLARTLADKTARPLPTAVPAAAVDAAEAAGLEEWGETVTGMNSIAQGVWDVARHHPDPVPEPS